MHFLIITWKIKSCCDIDFLDVDWNIQNLVTVQKQCWYYPDFYVSNHLFPKSCLLICKKCLKFFLKPLSHIPNTYGIKAAILKLKIYWIHRCMYHSDMDWAINWQIRSMKTEWHTVDRDECIYVVLGVLLYTCNCVTPSAPRLVHVNIITISLGWFGTRLISNLLGKYRVTWWSVKNNC